MATFNGGRMVALFLCVLFALNVSFAQDGWETIVVYMEDPLYMEEPLPLYIEKFLEEENVRAPIREEVAAAVEAYIAAWNDPLTWETEEDFKEARRGQEVRVKWENDMREKIAKHYLEDDKNYWANELGESDKTTWFPSWLPLLRAKTEKDSLFKNILDLKADAEYDVGEKKGQRQTLFEYLDSGGAQPAGTTASGVTQKFKFCDDKNPRCRKPLYSLIREWNQVDKHPSKRMISFTVKVKSYKTTEEDEGPGEGFADEIDKTSPEGGETKEVVVVEYDYDTIRLLQEAKMDEEEYVIDTPPYKTPAAKPVSSTETSSWGRIKETFAD